MLLIELSFEFKHSDFGYFIKIFFLDSQSKATRMLSGQSCLQSTDVDMGQLIERGLSSGCLKKSAQSIATLNIFK